MNDPYCSQLSQEHAEPMLGTAVHVKVWLLLEYSAVWQPKATNDNTLPPPVQAHLNHQLTHIPHSRLQFIKQTQPHARLRFYVAVVEEAESRLYRFELNSYEALLEIDIATVVAGNQSIQRTDERLILVCTNGKRDRCCAKFGLATYQALANEVGNTVWQTTHLGGHRFAPTLLTLPEGLLYGRVDPAGLSQFLANHHNHHITLPLLRGRTCYPPAVQAASAYLHTATNHSAIDSFHLLNAQLNGDNLWDISFQNATEQHHLQLHQEENPLPILASCGKPQKKPLYKYTVLKYTGS